MAAATAMRPKTCPSFTTPAGRFSVEDPHHHDNRTVYMNLRQATDWAILCSGQVLGCHWHVFDDHGRVVGRARDGVWHGAVA